MAITRTQTVQERLCRPVSNRGLDWDVYYGITNKVFGRMQYIGFVCGNNYPLGETREAILRTQWR